MFILVGADGNPLHDGVVTYRAKGGAGGAFSMEMNEIFKDLNDAYGKGKGNQRLNLFSAKNHHAGDMRSFVRLAMQFDLYKGGKDRAPYLVPVARVLPVGNPTDLKMNPPGEYKFKEVVRGKDGDRTVKLYPQLLIHKESSNMLVLQASPMGERIRAAIEEYKSFPLPMQGKESEGTESGIAERPYQGKGLIDPASLKTSPDGWATLNLLTESGSISILFSNLEDIDNIMAVTGNVSVTGIIPADGGPVTVTSWEDATPAPLADEQKSLVEAF
jgi:hypothetical protein